MKQIKLGLFGFLILFSVLNSFAQGVAINGDGSNADASAMLDVKAVDKGLLIPRVNIIDVNTAAPVISPSVSLLVYNTNTTTGVGYYFWNGSQWVRLSIADDLDFVDGTGVATRVAFWSDANTLTSDANLFWDDTNNRLGIRNASPTTPLYVDASSHSGTAMIVDRYASGGVASIQAGPSNEYLMLEGQGTTGRVGVNFYSSGHVSIVNGGGNLGVGTNSPSAQLHTTGTVRFANYASGANGAIIRTDASGNLGTTNFTGSASDILLGNNTFGTIEDAGGVVSSCGTANYVPKMINATEIGCSQIYDNGTNIGVGTTSPSQKMHIVGNSLVSGNMYINNAGYSAVHYGNVGLYGAATSWNPDPNGNNGVWIEGTNNGSESGGFFANGDCAVIWSPGDNDILRVYDEDAFASGPKMVLSGAGNLGVGTDSPGGKLEINMANNDNYFQVRNDNNVGVEMRSGTTLGTPYIDFSNDASSDYDARIRLTGNDYIAFEGTSVGIGTTAPTEKLHVVGNAKATGYITAGSATTSSTTRYGEQTIMWKGNESVDDDTEYVNIGTFSIPDNIPSSTTIYVDRIVWTCDAMHQDADETHAVRVKIGSSSYYGWSSSIQSGSNYIDWQFDTGTTTITNFTTDQILTMEIYDEGGSGGDDLIVYMMHVTVYYHYSSSLQAGDIAAEGRIYANNNTAIGDLAEHFEYDGPVAPGFVVSYVPGSDNEYVRCDEPYSNHITGVISENPSVVLNSPDQGPPIALAGRVKVKLIDSDELIQGGDFVTSSSQPGLAQKATKPGSVIGYAVKNQKLGENFVEILLQPGKFYFPNGYNVNNESNPEASSDKRKGKW